MNRNRKHHRRGQTRFVAMLAVLCAGVVGIGLIFAWKSGWFGGTNATGPAPANGADASSASSTERAGASTVSHQKIDESLDAAASYVNADRLGEAEKILEELVKVAPKNPAVLRQLYELRLFQRRYEDAYATIRALLEIDSDDPEQYFNAGTIAFKIGKLTQAAAHYQQAATMDVTNPKYPLYLAQTQVKLHEYSEAKINLLKVINLNGSVHEAFGTLAEIALIENRLDIAEQDIERARTVAPNFLKWRIVEAKIIRRKGKPEEALERLNAITDPKIRLLSEVVDEKAACWAMLGEPEKAAREYVDQVNAFPDAWMAAVHASEYYMIAGNEPKGKVWYLYAKGKAPEGAREIADLAKRFERGDAGGG